MRKRFFTRSQYRFRQLSDRFCKSVGYTSKYQVEVEEVTTIIKM
ncbi:MAG: hypothetical protein ABS939_06620 [Psychrobacillus sp.]